MFSICFSVPASHANVKLSYRIVKVLPHNNQSFTQGLVLDGEDLLESSGLYGKSYIARYHVESGLEISRQLLPANIFAEGITQVGDFLYVLTWRAGVVLVLHKHNFGFVKQMTYHGEGWGLTFDGQHLITSDGSARLTFRDRDTFAPIKRIEVKEGSRKWKLINELEFAQGFIWANVWRSSTILVIDPHDGHVIAALDMNDLVKDNLSRSPDEVLNGIAYDPVNKAFWVTGKNWHNRYLLEVNGIPAQQLQAPPQ